MGKQGDLESSLLPVILPRLEVEKPEVCAWSIVLLRIFTGVYSFWSVSSAELKASAPQVSGFGCGLSLSLL